MESTLATESTKTALENTVNWLLQDQLQATTLPIVTQKYTTNDNLLLYLTRCDVAEPGVPRIKVQIFARVDGGVHETSYQLYGDHRLERMENAMIFGSPPGTSPNEPARAVTETEAYQLIEQIKSLAQNARITS